MKKVILSCLFLALMIPLLYNHLTKKKESIPTLTLKGKSHIKIEVGQNYKEEGFTALDEIDGNLTDLVIIKDRTNYNVPGTYKRTYEVRNSSGKKIHAVRTITIEEKKKPIYINEYDKIDNVSRYWGLTNIKKNTRPNGEEDEDVLRKYHAYFLGKDEKVIYLTYDQGTSDTYVEQIVDILNQNGVKATFFFCQNYMIKNANLIRKIEETGHLIGNHTANHMNMPSLATRENFHTYVEQIQNVEKTYFSITGKPMEKVYREPKGEWSYRSLQIMKDLGYKSYFWSAAYVDFNVDVSKEFAYSELKRRIHNGVIYLIHPKNKGNYESLDSFIKDLKKEGYSFDRVDHI